MNWLEHIFGLVNPLDLANFYIKNIFNHDARLLMIDAIVILTLHGFYIYILTRAFGKLIQKRSIGKSVKASLLMYFVMILLVACGHVSDIFVLSLALESLHVFADPLSTFHYVSGMYTTTGSSLSPGHQWPGLSVLISFTGLIAFSISGSGLFTMLGYFIAAENRK